MLNERAERSDRQMTRERRETFLQFTFKKLTECLEGRQHNLEANLGFPRAGKSLKEKTKAEHVALRLDGPLFRLTELVLANIELRVMFVFEFVCVVWGQS